MQCENTGAERCQIEWQVQTAVGRFSKCGGILGK